VKTEPGENTNIFNVIPEKRAADPSGIYFTAGAK